MSTSPAITGRPESDVPPCLEWLSRFACLHIGLFVRTVLFFNNFGVRAPSSTTVFYQKPLTSRPGKLAFL